MRYDYKKALRESIKEHQEIIADLVSICDSLIKSNGLGTACLNKRYDGQHWITSVEVFRSALRAKRKYGSNP